MHFYDYIFLCKSRTTHINIRIRAFVYINLIAIRIIEDSHNRSSDNQGFTINKLSSIGII